MLESGGASRAIAISSKYDNREAIQIRFRLACLSLAITSPLDVEHFAPIHSGHPKRNSDAISFGEQFAYALGSGLPSLIEANQRISIKDVASEG